MDKDLICKMYQDGFSMRGIALHFGTNHKRISRILYGKKIRIRKPQNLRGVRKFECSKERAYHNMATHLRFDVSKEWLVQYSNFEKLKCLNDMITNRNGRFEWNTEQYKAYIQKFYNDLRFNKIYEKWVESSFNKWFKPSIDHIKAKSNGGFTDIDNLQILTWFENRCKSNIPQKEWDAMKKNIGDYFI